MSPRDRRPAPRGMSLLEVMISLSVLLVAMLGFVATMNFAAGATGAAQRQTVNTFLRSSLIDRLTVTPRAALVAVPATWVIDTCYDVHGQPIAPDNHSGAAPYDTAYTCPTPDPANPPLYRSWVLATPNTAFANWAISLYVERIDSGCTDLTDATRQKRNASQGCSPAELLLTN